MISTREERGVQIAASGGVKQGSAGWWVKSQSNPRVEYWCNTERCTCPDYLKRQKPCKHMEAVHMELSLQERKTAEAARAPKSEAERAARKRQAEQDIRDIWG